MNVDLHFHLIPPFFVDELQTSNPWHKSVVSGPEGSMVLKVGKLDFPLAPNHYDTDAYESYLAGLFTQRHLRLAMKMVEEPREIRFIVIGHTGLQFRKRIHRAAACCDGYYK